MDFMRILLTYMATTLLVAVESTATPSVTPVPTPGAEETPPAVVTEAPAEISAEPTISVTPVPVPTISPNPKYRTLSQGDRGEEVRRLQERLIELGYLPEGSADGAYGGQTRNAVRKFQYYNSLRVDGISGKSTQTNLFENPDVMPYPGAATEKPSAEPTPAENITDVPVEETTTPPPEETETPAPTDQPKEKDTEIPAEEPKRTEDPAMTEEPEETEIPALTEKPEETEVPVLTDEPEEKDPDDPTEEPENTETPELTDEPEEKDPEMPTEEPEGTETPELTDEPNEKDTDVPTEGTEAIGTPTPTEASETERPAVTAENTEIPSEETPVAEETKAMPTEIIEDVDLEDEYEDLAGWIVLNDSGAAMQWNALQDGVTVLRSPRMQSKEEQIRVSLDDMVQCVEEWMLTDDGDTIVLEAEGYTLGLFNEEAGFVATVDGMELVTDSQDFDFIRDGHFIDIDFLTRALNGTWEWDAEEWTLMLRIPGKSVTNATD